MIAIEEEREEKPPVFKPGKLNGGHSPRLEKQVGTTILKKICVVSDMLSLRFQYEFKKEWTFKSEK